MPNFEELEAAANTARGLAMDAVAACASGHLGLPLGAAEVGAVRYGELLRHDPADPAWINRDRFVLSAGHGSMFLYAWLHLCGYPLSLDAHPLRALWRKPELNRYMNGENSRAAASRAFPVIVRASTSASVTSRASTRFFSMTVTKSRASSRP